MNAKSNGPGQAGPDQDLSPENWDPEKLLSEYYRLERLNALLHEELIKLSRMLYGPSSEKSKNIIANIEGILEAEPESNDPQALDMSVVEIEHPESLDAGPSEEPPKQKQNRGGTRSINRDGSFANVERNVIEHKIESLACESCGSEMREMGSTEREELVYVPEHFRLDIHRTFAYNCPCCSEEGKSHILRAPSLKALQPGSFASPSAVSGIISLKYVDGLPLHRIQKLFGRHGADISRQTMSNWLIHSSETSLEPVYDLLVQGLLARPSLQADESTLQVLIVGKARKYTDSFMWQYRTAPGDPVQIVVFEYRPGRGAKYPKAFLEGYGGLLATDGYSSYNGLGQLHANCFAHVRRKFFDAYKALGKDPPADSPPALGLAQCDRLFELEREYKGMSAEERYFNRLSKPLPVAVGLFKWAKQQQALPQTAMGKAISYLLNHEEQIMNIFRDGRIELSTNAVENTFRPYVIGRKSWLFSNTDRGAKASATIYTIVETAKANGLNPEKYIEHILEQSRGGELNVPAESLLPWSESLPEACFELGAARPKPPEAVAFPVLTHEAEQLAKMHLLGWQPWHWLDGQQE